MRAPVQERRLTPRQLQLVALRKADQPYKVIASELGITENTVKVHFRRIYERLGVNSTIGLLNALA